MLLFFGVVAVIKQQQVSTSLYSNNLSCVLKFCMFCPNISVVCDPPCVNGACVQNNNCSCSEGYEGDTCDVSG